MSLKAPPRMRIVYFRHETELNSELSWSRWILNSLIYSYSDKFISHVASKHAVWHLYFCSNTMICLKGEKMKIRWISRILPIGKHSAEKKCSVTITASILLV